MLFRSSVIPAAFAATAFLWTVAAHAQTAAPLSAVKVTVVDQSGAEVADSDVIFKSNSMTVVLRIGEFGIGTITTILPSGRYSVTVRHSGFLKKEINDFEVSAPEPKDIRVVLKVDPQNLPCGPCGCDRCHDVEVPTIPATLDSPDVIVSRPSDDSAARPAARKIRSLRCLYL